MALPLENIDIETVTLGELAKIYTREQELKSPLSLGNLLKKYENTPAIEVFREEGGVPSLAKEALRKAQAEGATDSVQKGALKTLRYLSNRIYNAYPSDPPSFLVPNEKNNPKSAIEFFGVKEPAKAVSMLQVSTDEEVIGEFVRKLVRYGKDNPDKMPHVRAIMFGMNTGLRPNASLGITVGQYNPSKGAIYIPATETGAKGRAISIPLSNMADAMLQEQNKNVGRFYTDENSPMFLDTNGKPLKTTDINTVLSEIKVPGLVFDESTGVYYDSLKPEGTSGSKFGMSLFRNYHATRGEELRISDGILGKLEGRSLNSVGKDPGTGELYTYRSRYPFRVSDYERSEANKFANDFEQYISEAVEEIQAEDPDFTFDRGSPADIDKTRRVEFLDDSGENYFGRVKVDTADKPATGTRLSEDAAQVSDDDIIGKILKGFGKTLSVLPVAGLGASALFKAEEVEADPTKTPAEGAVEFVAEEFTPLGVVKPVVEAAAEPVAEEYTEQTEEAGLAGDEESQVFRLFGENPFK